MLGKMLGGAARPFTDTAETYMRESGQTRRAEVAADRATEEKRLATTAALQAGQSTWRPLWMHTIRRLLRWYFGLSFVGGVISFLMLLAVFLEQVQYSQWMQIKDDLIWFLASWGGLGGSLITVATWSFLGYSPFRSMFDKNGGQGAQTVANAARKVRDALPRRQQPEVVREPMQEGPAEIERIPGVEYTAQTTVPAPARNVPPAVLLGAAVDGERARHYKGWKISKRTKANLSTVDPKLAAVALRAFNISKYDFVVIQGVRAYAEQVEHYNAGRSKTLKSRHIEIPSQAFDIMAIDENGAGTWGTGRPDDKYYFEIARAMRLAAADVGIGITCGIDWGWDSGHYERSRDEVPFTWPPGVDVNLS